MDGYRVNSIRPCKRDFVPTSNIGMLGPRIWTTGHKDCNTTPEK